MHWAVTYITCIVIFFISMGLIWLFFWNEDRLHRKQLVMQWDLFINALNSKNTKDMEKYLEDHKVQTH